MQLLWKAITEGLQQIGAVTVKHGKDFGLRAYPDLHRQLCPVSKAKGYEEPITEALSILLSARGFPSKTEERYSTCSGRCDLRVDLTRMLKNERLWVEVKTAHTEIFNGDSYEACNASKYHGWKLAVHDRKRGKDIRHDFEKLTSLRREQADFVGILYLGFDRSGCSLEDAGFFDLLFTRIPELRDWKQCHELPGGQIWPDSYPGRAQHGYQERALLWYNAVT